MLTSRVENDGTLMAVHEVYDVPASLGQHLIDAEQAESVTASGDKPSARRERATKHAPETRSETRKAS